MKKFFKKILIKIITWQSKIVVLKYKPKVIAITGSVGKTSTKQAIYSIISSSATVRMSEKNYYNEIGLPLTILGCYDGGSDFFMWAGTIIHGLSLILWKHHKYPQYIILEIGLRKSGDIKNQVARWLKPDVVIVTRFSDCPSHIEFFENIEELESEKKSLVQALKKDGLLILNNDDPRVYNLYQHSEARTISFGANENSTYQIIHLEEEKNLNLISGINFKINYEGNTYPVSLPNILGLHYAGIIASALACAKELGFGLLESIENISNYKNPPGRLSLLQGINNSFIIDDSYNSSPLAQKIALDVLKETPGIRKIAVLGDMLELGKHTDEEHFSVGVKASEVADKIVLIGQRAEFIAEGAISNGFPKKNIIFFNDLEKTGEYVEKEIGEGDVVLVKGSQKMRMEKIVERIILEKDKKSELLCRQNKEWK